MSFTINGTGHDTHLYDPERHDNQIVAVFEDDAAAARAGDALRAAGVAERQIRVVNAPAASPAPQSSGEQILNAFSGLFGSEEDHGHYQAAVERGHAMVIVTPNGALDRHRLIEALERTHPIDFDAKLEEWRQAGYEGMETAADGERRVGQRETMDGGSRVRSYVAERPSDGGSATPNVESSGMNTPRPR